MPSVMSIFKSSHLHLLYDLFRLSMRITFAMILATFKVVLPCRGKSLLGETVLVNENNVLLNILLFRLHYFPLDHRRWTRNWSRTGHSVSFFRLHSRLLGHWCRSESINNRHDFRKRWRSKKLKHLSVYFSHFKYDKWFWLGIRFRYRRVEETRGARNRALDEEIRHTGSVHFN